MNRRFVAVLVGALCLVTACSTDPNEAKRRYVARGNKYYDNGKYREALIMYKNALRKDGKYGEAYYRAALAELAMGGQVLAVVRDLHRAVELQPDNLDAYNRLINIYINAYLADRRRPPQYVSELKGLADRLQKNKHANTYEFYRANGYIALMENKLKDGINYFEKANSIKPLQPDVSLVYLQSLAADGRSAEAEKLGWAMINKDPHVATIYDAMFLEYMRQKRLDDAEKILRLKVDNNPTVQENYLQLAAHYYTQRDRAKMQQTLGRLTADTKKFPTAYKSVGDFYLRIKDVDQAIQNYNEGIKIQPKDKHSYQKRIIEALVLQDKKPEATNILNEILKEDPKDDEAVAIRASLLMLSGNRDQLQSAINDLQSVVSRMPDNPVLRFNLGRAHLAKGNVQQARIQFEEAIKLRQDYLLPRIALAQILQQNGEFGRVVQMAGEILAYDPSNLQAKLLRTRALIGMGETKQARQELSDMQASNPDVWEAKLQLAALDMNEKNYRAAEDTFRKMYTETGDPRALMGLTETYTTQAHFDQAMQVLQDEVKKHPERVDYLVALGNIAVRAEKYGPAIDYYKQVLDKQPRSADVWIRLGETERRKGDTKAAMESFGKAKELAPTNALPYVQLALMYDAMGQRDQARPLYEQVLRIQPDHPIALNNLAFMLAETGADLDQAMTMAQRAKQKMPTNDDVGDTLAWIYIKKNLSDSAISILQDLTRKQPNRSTFHYHMAMALAQKGDKVQARREADIAARSNPAPDEQKKIQELAQRIK